jgi:hypothetical protein
MTDIFRTGEVRGEMLRINQGDCGREEGEGAGVS